MNNSQQLYPHQIQSIACIEEAEKNIYNSCPVAILGDIPGYGKCHGKNTKILMYDGTVKLVQDIQVGDKLMGDDSTPRVVLSLAVGIDELFRVYQSQGESYTVNKSHILSLKIKSSFLLSEEVGARVYYFKKSIYKYKNKYFTSIDKAQEFISSLDINEYIDVPLNEYLNNSHLSLHSRGYQRRVEFPYRKVPLPPYHVGLWSNSISSLYLFNSRKIRLELLSGIIDARGKLTPEGFCIFYENLNSAHELLFLSRSLGMGGMLVKDKNKFKVMFQACKKDGLRVNFPLQETSSVRGESVLSVFSLGVGEYYGFTLDGNHRYMLWDCTVTHNTKSVCTVLKNDKMKFIPPPRRDNLHLRIENICYKTINSSLVVISPSISKQWEKELQNLNIKYHLVKNSKSLNFQENLPVILCLSTWYNNLIDHLNSGAGSYCEEMDLSNIESKKVEELKNLLRHYNLRVSGKKKELVEKLKEYKEHRGEEEIKREIYWKRFIFDEPCSSHIPQMRRSYAQFYLLISATYERLWEIRGRLNFIKMLFKRVSLEAVTLVCNDEDFVRSCYEIPEPLYITHQCYNPAVLEVVGDMLPSNVREALQAGDTSSALISLGIPSFKGSIIELMTERKNRELEKALTKQEKYSKIFRKTKYNKWTEKVKKIISQLQSIEERSSKLLSEPCSICYDSLTVPSLTPCCQNVFCSKCIIQWLGTRTSCPMCRGEINIKDLVYLTQEKENNTFNNRHPREKTRQETVVEIISSKENGRFIIASNHDSSFDSISSFLMSNDIACYEVKGTDRQREKIIKQYEEGKVKVLFLNSRFNGAGINLPSTTDLILYHEMDDSLRKQIIGRANRIGRTGVSLVVHQLV